MQLLQLTIDCSTQHPDKRLTMLAAARISDVPWSAGESQAGDRRRRAHEAGAASTGHAGERARDRRRAQSVARASERQSSMGARQTMTVRA